jgi:hypothetical protein
MKRSLSPEASPPVWRRGDGLAGRRLARPLAAALAGSTEAADCALSADDQVRGFTFFGLDLSFREIVASDVEA